MHKPTLLYAEDDRETRENYTFVLKKYFHEVYSAKDGKEALDIYREKKPDMLLLDISMPQMNGLELAKAVRKEDKSTPIIMLTAHSDQEKLLRAIPLGLSEYLLKPVDDVVLINTVNRLISQMKKSNTLYLKGNCMWDRINSELSYRKKSIDLTKKETILMKMLTASIGQYVSKDALIMDVWREEMYDSSHENKLIQLVYRLNKKITSATDYNNQFIENSYALGYRLLLD